MDIILCACITLAAAAVSYLAGRHDERRQREQELDELLRVAD